ncbi:MAG: hypothetical protein Q9196_002317 [Gyalolechia fulgens]
MPTHAHQRPKMVEDFCTRAQARFSAFFHGHSVITKERYGTPHVKTKAMNSYRPRVAVAEDGLRRDGPGSRSRTSTRSLIDPISSPLCSPVSPQTEELWHYRGAFFRPVSTIVPGPRVEAQIDHRSRGSFPAHHEGPSQARKLKEERRCVPTVTDRQIKYKIIGSLISGTLLVLLLTIYLGLAVSGSISDKSVHVIMIVLILFLTMLFCHFLIRLCMLSLRLRDRTKRRIKRVPSAADDEELAQPQSPIPVILARDEELGLHEGGSDNDSIKPVQPPPPAYGVWRSSVVSAGWPESLLLGLLDVDLSSVRTLISYTGNEQIGCLCGNAKEKLLIWLSILLCVRRAITRASPRYPRAYIPRPRCQSFSR